MKIGRITPAEAGEADSIRGFDAFEVSLGDTMRGERATLGKSLLDVQRELRIKAIYIAAIEAADPAAFETPGFIAGYVRSYARYLGLDPEWAFARFCAESGFQPAHGMSAASSGPRKPSAAAPLTLSADKDIFASEDLPYLPRGSAALRRIDFAALGSAAVMVALVGAIGWGGWTVLQEVQRVELVPVDAQPVVLSQIDPLAPAPAAPDANAAPQMAVPTPDALERLYRPRALDVPVLVARDGPIAAIDPALPDRLDPRARTSVSEVAEAEGPEMPEGPPLPVAGAAPSAIEGAVLAALAEAGVDDALPERPIVVAGVAAPVELVAVRPSWVRVRAADGSTLYEAVMNPGDRFALPALEEAPTLRTGNAGGVYFAIGGKTYGPAGEGPSIVSGLALSPEALTGAFAEADPEADPELKRIVALAQAGQ